jgi:amino-acid N-acetyltransferase
MAILSSQATRRDAKSYFGRFGREELYSKGSRPLTMPVASLHAPKTIRLALIKLCQADTLSSVAVLPGLAKTFVQLGRLGMPVCLVLEPEDNYTIDEPPSPWKSITVHEKYGNLTDRIVNAIEAQGGRAQPILGEFLTQIEQHTAALASTTQPSSSKIVDQIKESILNPRVGLAPVAKGLLYDLMKRGQIPVVAPIASGSIPSLSPISADCALYRICEGISASDSLFQTSIERVIIIDPIGGLPATERRGGSHLYINLQQEYEAMQSEMSRKLHSDHTSSSLAAAKSHLRNLILEEMCLSLLKPTSSGLITTPIAASAKPTQSTPQSLIHNLLTDKPLISPSLPAHRPTTPTSATTLLRKGLPVVVYQSIDMQKDDRTQLEFSRLVQLIEDSFGRRLDVDHYRNRIRNKTAAIIVAGDYEGAAVVTKESAAEKTPHGSWVPYLDKFAVSTKSQGSGGVADIVFNVLMSTFPEELIWRSRKSNPVNKWVCQTNFHILFTPTLMDSILSVLEELGSCLELIGAYFGHPLMSLQTSLQSMLISLATSRRHGNDIIFALFWNGSR